MRASMASGGTISRLICLVAALALAAPITACGKKKEDPVKMPVTGPGAPKGAPSPREAIIQFFEAKRVGNTELGCSLESEDFQRAQYNGVAEACMRASTNQHPQTVWREEIKIDKLDEAPDSAAARIRPNKQSNEVAEITLVRGKGGWLVNSLR